MKQNSRIQRETVLSIAAAAIAVPLIAVPAAAGLDGGRFFVKAWNVEDPSIMVIAGYGGIGHGGQIPGGGSGGTGPGGGSTNPGDGTTPGGGNGGTGPGGGTGGSNPNGGSGSTPQSGEPGSGSGADSGSSADSSAVLNSFAFGGLQLKITQNMVDFSRANEKLIAEGRGSDTVVHSDGWRIIASDNEGSPSLGWQSGAPGYYLSSAYSEDRVAIFDGVVAAGIDYGFQRIISDFRARPAEGVLTAYADVPGTPYKNEAAYRTVEGELIIEEISRMPQGDSIRRTMVDRVSPFLSNTIPESLSRFPDGRISRVQLNPKTINDSYEFVVITVAQDGSGSTSYRRSFGGTPVQRKLGPEEIYWDKNGAITELVYMDGTNRRSVKGDVSVAAYNGASGDNWDGSYLKPSDFAAQANF